MNGMIIVLSGPSGAGKGRIFEEIAKRRNNVHKILSVTTRARRKEEIGKDAYVYVSRQEFESMIEKNMFFEWEEYDGNLYGTLNVPTEELSTVDLFFDKDVRGAISIKDKYPEAITIYVMPKNKEILEKRRGKRGSKRAEIARGEIELAKQLDFLVINDDIDEAVKQVETIIECMRQNSMKNERLVWFLDNFY